MEIKFNDHCVDIVRGDTVFVCMTYDEWGQIKKQATTPEVTRLRELVEIAEKFHDEVMAQTDGDTPNFSNANYLWHQFYALKKEGNNG